MYLEVHEVGFSSEKSQSWHLLCKILFQSLRPGNVSPTVRLNRSFFLLIEVNRKSMSAQCISWAPFHIRTRTLYLSPSSYSRVCRLSATTDDLGSALPRKCKIRMKIQVASNANMRTEEA